MFSPNNPTDFLHLQEKNANPLVHFIHVLVETDDDRNQNNGMIRVNIHNFYEIMLVGLWDSHLPHHNLKMIYKYPLILKPIFDKLSPSICDPTNIHIGVNVNL